MDDGKAERIRLTRAGDDRGPSLAERIGERLAELRFASPIHRMRLKGRFPLKLLAVPKDPVPGDPDRGQRLRAGRLYAHGHGVALATGPLDDRSAPEAFRRWLHGWTWLRDAAACPPATTAEAQRIEQLARRWLERFADYDPESWAPDLTGRRILMAIAHAPLLIPRHDHVHRSAVLNGIARWTRHLDRAARALPPGCERLEAALGLLGGALLLPGNDDRQARGEALVEDTLAALVREDGGAVARSPLVLGTIGDWLLLVADFYAARGARPGAAVVDGLARVRAGLGVLAMGDGKPAPWHGGQPSLAQMQRLAPSVRKQPAAAGGFVRLVSGRTVVVMDAGPPPPARAALATHASTLAIVISDSGQPLVVSCGGAHAPAPEGMVGLPLASELAEGLRATAAHSALVIEDTNSTRLKIGPTRRPGGVHEVLLDWRATAEGQWLEARHDGYRSRFGFDHVRRLWLAADGRNLRGEDQLLPSGPRRLGRPAAVAVAVRFHLAPGAVLSPTGDGRGALIRVAGARPKDAVAWSFRAQLPEGGRLALEPSLCVSEDGEARATQQILLQATAQAGVQLSIAWAFARQTRDA